MLQQWNKLRDRRKPLRADAEQALNKLGQLAKQQPHLADLAATYAALIDVSFRDSPAIPQWTPDATHAAAKLAAGVPLLRGEALPLDGHWLRDQCRRLCAAVIDQHTQQGKPARSSPAYPLHRAVEQGQWDVHALAIDVLNGDPQRVIDQAAQHDLDAGLAATLLRWTLLPMLEPLAHKLEPIRAQVVWNHGYCPTCGAWPLLAEQRGIEQARYLRCGLCATSWGFERVACPFCTSRTPGDSAYLYEEAQEAHQRVVTCERCHGYFKAIATLVPFSTPHLYVADLATLHLDLIALERAYAAPG